MTKIIRKTLFPAILIVSMIVSMYILVPASAENLNWPDDTYKIDYLTAGGDAQIAIPEQLKTIFPTYTQMRLRTSHCEIPNAGISDNYLLISFYDPTREAAGKDPWEPYAMITDANDDIVAFEENFWYGTWINMDATLYNYPAFLSANNVIQVDKGDLTIERNGNNLVVNLNEEQTVKKAFTLATTFKVPTFALEITSFGCSNHESNSVTMLGWRGATGYTIDHNRHYFEANGIFASQGTYLDGKSTLYATLLMQGTHVFHYP